MKLRDYGQVVRGDNRDCGRLYVFHCPGCGYDHGFHAGGDPAAHPQWEFNGDMDRPTISPSLLVNKDSPEFRCHSFIKNGMIEFLGDCHHGLKNKTVEIPEQAAEMPAG